MALTPRQKQVLDLKKKGMNQTQIAKELGVKQNGICRIQNELEFKKAWAKVCEAKLPMTQVRLMQQDIMREEIQKSLDPVIQTWKDGALPAAQNIVALSTSAEEESIQFAASKEVVNQAGYVPEKKVTTMTIELSGQDAERISNAFKLSQTRTREIVST